jgi:hypothetical protein
VTERVRNEMRGNNYGTIIQAVNVRISQGGESPEDTLLSSEAVLRGPISALGKGAELKNAKVFLESDPHRAAELFDEIANALGAAKFFGHELAVREDQVKALEKAGEYLAAVRVRLSVGWRSFRSGQSWSSLNQVRSIARYEKELSPVEIRMVNGLSAAASMEHDVEFTLGRMEEVFDSQDPSDQGHFELALAMAEESAARRRAERLLPKADRLRSLALERLEEATEDTEFADPVRLLMCLCDATEEWEELEEQSRTFPGGIRAWVTARHARGVLLQGDGRKAEKLWVDAAKEATAHRRPQSAADWLASKQMTRGLFKVFEVGNTDHLVIQALRAGGREASLTGLHRPENLTEQALAGMFDERWRNSLAPLQRLLKHAVATADMTGEFQAHERLGDLYANTGRWRESVEHYVMAGRTKKVRTLALSLPDQPVSLELPTQKAPPWEISSWLEFVSGAASVMDDATARTWAEYVFVLLGEETSEDSVGRQWEPCLQALPALADALPEEGARACLDYAFSRLERPKGEHHKRDKELLRAVSVIARVHPHLKTEALRCICRGVLLGDITGREALGEGGRLLYENPELSRSFLSGVDVDDESEPALIGLVLAGDISESLREYARERWSRAIKPKQFTPGRMEVGTNLRESARFTTVLGTAEQRRFAEAMLIRAKDERDDAHNRDDALVALAVVGPSLRGQVDDVFASLVEFACGPVRTETIFDWSTDPLAFVRTTSSPPPLAAQALETAETLASDEEQFIALKNAVFQLLRDADSLTCNRLAVTLSRLPAELFRTDLPLLAAHTDHDVRAASAVIWVRTPHLWPSLGDRLASDPEPSVRRALASGLGDEPLHRSVVDVLRADHRRDVRTLLPKIQSL